MLTYKMSIQRTEKLNDYWIMFNGKLYDSLNTLHNNTLNDEWFLVKKTYNNGVSSGKLYLKKDMKWYKHYNCDEFYYVNIKQPILDAYNDLIKKEIYNFTTNSILIQDLLIPDAMNYIRQFI